MTTDWDYFIKARKAEVIARKAVKDGKLERPASCELCGATHEPLRYTDRNGVKITRARIFAHHWNGYDHPLDVWFICYSCNAKLRGKDFHNGTMTMEQAREFIFSPRRLQSRYVKCKSCNCWAGKGSDYCHHHQPNVAN